MQVEGIQVLPNQELVYILDSKDIGEKIPWTSWQFKQNSQMKK